VRGPDLRAGARAARGGASVSHWQDEARGIEPWPGAKRLGWSMFCERCGDEVFQGPVVVDLADPDTLAAFDRRLLERLGAPREATAQGAGIDPKAARRLAAEVPAPLRPLADAERAALVWPTSMLAHLWMIWARGGRHDKHDYLDHVYLIGRRPDAIKIGFSRDYRRRFASLQTGAPEPLDLLLAMPGTRGDEGRLHRAFAADRLGGEWFRAEEVAEFGSYAADCLWRWQAGRERVIAEAA
jgi:hypothetical protein